MICPSFPRVRRAGQHARMTDILLSQKKRKTEKWIGAIPGKKQGSCTGAEI